MKTNNYLTAKDYIIAIITSIIIFILISTSIPNITPVTELYINISDFCFITTLIITIIAFIVVLFVCKINNYIKYKEKD